MHQGHVVTAFDGDEGRDKLILSTAVVLLRSLCCALSVTTPELEHCAYQSLLHWCNEVWLCWVMLHPSTVAAISNMSARDMLILESRVHGNKNMHTQRKGHRTDFTCRVQFIYDKRRFTAHSESSCKKSCVVLERDFKVWEYNPGDVIVMSSRLSTVLPEASKRALKTVSVQFEIWRHWNMLFGWITGDVGEIFCGKLSLATPEMDSPSPPQTNLCCNTQLMCVQDTWEKDVCESPFVFSPQSFCCLQLNLWVEV